MDRGFSLVELIMVLLILGALSVFALPRMMNVTSMNEVTFQQELLDALRYAQKLAIATGCPVRVAVSSAANDYVLNFPTGTAGAACGGGGGYTVAVPHPARSGNYSGTAPAGVALSDLTVVFDALGRPDAGGSVSVGGRGITVEGETGYVHG